MAIIALLNWYEESPTWLAECVAATARLADHIIAVDGPYAGFPGAMMQPASGTDQADAILRTAAGAGIGCTIHQSRKVWWGDEWGGEVAKRDFMFQLGMTFAQPGDWFFRVDADEIISDVPADTKSRLAATDAHAAEVMLWQREASSYAQHPLRCLFRAIPGIRIEQAHFVVTAPVDGKREFLAGPKALPAEPLWDVRLEHRTHLRTDDRKRLKDIYSPMINDFERVESDPR
jgi:hypothetical protein